MNSLIIIISCYLYSRMLELANFTYKYIIVSETLLGWNLKEVEHMASFILSSSLLAVTGR